MSKDHGISAEKLEALVQQAAIGSKEAAREFFEAFLAVDIVVLERHQSAPLSNTPEYPNDFINILGVQDKERVVVPVFTVSEHIEDWSGQSFSHRTMSVTRLLELIPEDWWISLNPGNEFGKDFSPWEISELKLGPESIPDLLEENFANENEPVQVQELKDSEYKKLKAALTELAEQREPLIQMCLLKEISLEDEKVRLLLGVWTQAIGDKEAQSIREEVEVVTQKHLIGAEPFRVYLGELGSEDFKLKIFERSQPFYVESEKASPLSRIGRFFKNRRPLVK